MFSATLRLATQALRSGSSGMKRTLRVRDSARLTWLATAALVVFVTVQAFAVFAPIVTGATRALFEPMNAPSPITVRYLRKPS